MAQLNHGDGLERDFANSVRPIFFQTELEEFLYATHGGTMFVVRFRDRLYGLTCKHVFREFEPSKLFIADEKQAKKGSKPAPIKTLCYPSSPIDEAEGTDVDDICVIEFDDDIAPDFFKGGEYNIDEHTVATSQVGHALLVAGVLKEKSQIDPPDIAIGYCRLEFQDVGPASDPFLRHAIAQFLNPEFSSIVGISGSPVFDRVSNALCGMVIRGGMTGSKCEIRYIDIFDIVRLLESVSEGVTKSYYKKNVLRPVKR